MGHIVLRDWTLARYIIDMDPINFDGLSKSMIFFIPVFQFAKTEELVKKINSQEKN